MYSGLVSELHDNAHVLPLQGLLANNRSAALVMHLKAFVDQRLLATILPDNKWNHDSTSSDCCGAEDAGRAANALSLARLRLGSMAELFVPPPDAFSPLSGPL